MNLENYLEIYELISESGKNNSSRKNSILVRSSRICSISGGFNKLAFDTRRIDQETEFNPRRGLQNYHRSEKFVTESMAAKISAFTKLSKILDELKSEYDRQPEWQDSYTRVLASAIHKSLRKDQMDGDFSEVQPSMTSLSYLEELLFVRYRITPEILISNGESEIRSIILGKDDLLSRGSKNDPSFKITAVDVGNKSYEEMFNKMLMAMSAIMSQKQVQKDDSLTGKLFDVQATYANPDVERTITITIKDKLNESISKTGLDNNLIKV